MNHAALLALFSDPAETGRRAIAARHAAFGATIWIRSTPAHPAPALAALIQDDRVIDLSPVPQDMSFTPEGHAPDDMSPATGPEGHAPDDMSPATGPEGHAPDDMSPATGPEGHAPDDMSPEPAWPDPAGLRPGDRLVLAVDHDQLPAYCAWLLRAAAAASSSPSAGWSLAPFSPRPGGLFRLHLIAAARLALPAGVRVEVRHDLHGVRLAQVALQFGADTLAGPLDAGRHLPLAGVPRPSETSAMALGELVRQAGFEPELAPIAAAPNLTATLPPNLESAP